ncbi:pilJ [Acinetobacter baumannii]
MGFKLKKKSGNRGATGKSSVNFIAKIQSKIEQFASLFGESLCTRQISQNPYPIRILPS